MYVRKKKMPKSTAVQIVASVRDGDKIQQKIIKHVGVGRTQDEIDQLITLATNLKKSLEQKSNDHPVIQEPSYVDNNVKLNAAFLSEERRIINGIHDVYGSIYNQLGFNHLLKKNNRTVNIIDTLYHTVMARIASPKSKLATSEMLEQDYGESIPVDHIYRMMDKLDEAVCDRVKAISYETAKSLLGSEAIKVIFYDATTLYFESFCEDELKQNGYSKDMKFNQPQVLLSIAVTNEGLPIHYDVFPGKKYEGHTLLDAVKKIEEKYQDATITIVADSGMLNKDNIDYLKAKGIGYIVGARVKNMKAAIAKQIFDLGSYTALSEGLRCKRIELDDGQFLIVTHSEKRAKKDAFDREKSVQKLTRKLSKSSDPASLISNYGYKKYVDIDTKKSTVSVNQKKINDSAKWDGIHGVIINNADMENATAIAQYKGLWQVEETFRIAKSHIKIRPIYHWTESRIRAHILISYIALTCIRYAQHRVKIQLARVSPSVLVQILKNVYITVIKDQKSGQVIALPSKGYEEAKGIYKIFGIGIKKKPFYYQM